MTTLQKEKSMPIWIVVTANMLRIASMLFKKAVLDADASMVDDCRFNAWLNLRDTAAYFFNNRTLEISVVRREKMIGALRIAHDSVHDGHAELSIERCTCAMASEQRALAVLMAEETMAA
jgi:phosphopantetheine adenylyltransferase